MYQMQPSRFRCGEILKDLYDQEYVFLFAANSHPALARQVAAINGWKYAEFEGDIRLLRMMTEGTWTDEEFCICPPRHRVEAEYTGKKIQAVPLGADAV